MITFLILRPAGSKAVANCEHWEHVLLVQRQHMEHRQHADFKLDQSGSDESAVPVVGTGPVSIRAAFGAAKVAARGRYHLKGRVETAETARQSVISTYADLKRPHRACAATEISARA